MLVKQVLDGQTRPTLGRIHDTDRITSYNVCYTKLLRDHQWLCGDSSAVVGTEPKALAKKMELIV